jgi:3-phosphoshikimate 1-carboxyvinyltransferase
MSSASIKISAASKKLDCTIPLTGSKSECNRALIMQALSDGAVQVDNISEAADTVTLNNILNADYQNVVDIGPAGTAMRFLTAFFSVKASERILTGSARMKQRPIGILVDALRTLGADIEYVEKEGFPPLKIKGPLQQITNEVSIKGNISSQYISALLLVAPKLEQGLNLVIEGELTSKPYVQMTLAMMEQAGIRHTWKDNIISIGKQHYNQSLIIVEPDWSAASYWYAIAALSEEARLFLPGLNGYSLQGDSMITEIMANFGISSQFKDGGVYLYKEEKKLVRKIFDFKECPDLAQTVIVCCAALGHDATFTGLETLKIKETDRVNALQTELSKIGVKLIEKNQTYKLDCSGLDLNKKIKVATYDDHRMAMAFAPLALLMPELEIEDHLVVEKSYPDFWKHLEIAGFKLRVES